MRHILLTTVLAGAVALTGGDALARYRHKPLRAAQSISAPARDPFPGVDIFKMIDGRCDLRIGGETTACNDKLAYIHSRAAMRTTIAITSQPLHIIAFSGGRDAQPDLEHYQLTVNRLTLADGLDVPASGVCNTNLNAEGSRVFKVDCTVVAQNGMSFALNFIPADKSPVDALAGDR